MPKASGMACYFCAGEVEELEHIALDEEGELVYLCKHCYNLAKKFFVKEESKNES